MKVYTLRDEADAEEPTLTEEELHKLTALLGRKCRKQTKDRLYYAIKFNSQSLGIFERVHVRPCVRYVAGQCYPTEITYIRKLLLG
jgi:hypothetical protein